MMILMENPRKGGRPDRGRTVHINHRCTPAWRDWVNAYARSKRKAVADLIAEALEVLARLDRFDPPPPER
jgi:hypothetical protein